MKDNDYEGSRKVIRAIKAAYGHHPTTWESIVDVYRHYWIFSGLRESYPQHVRITCLKNRNDNSGLVWGTPDPNHEGTNE